MSDSERKYIKYKTKYLATKAGQIGGDAIKIKQDLTGTTVDLSNWIYQEGAVVTFRSLVHEKSYEKSTYPEFHEETLSDPEITRIEDNDNEYIERKSTVTDGPVDYYTYICKRYGMPTYIVNQPGGICKWINGRTEKLIFPHEEIILKDEYVRHVKPGIHYDFIYSIIKVYVPPEKLLDILRISGSINYDPLLKHLRARCGGFSANFATFKSVLEVLEGHKTDYGQNITTKEERMHANELATTFLVNTNQPKYRIELAQDAYPIDRIG